MKDLRQRQRHPRNTSGFEPHNATGNEISCTNKRKRDVDLPNQLILFIIVMIYSLGLYSLVHYSTHYLPAPKFQVNSKPKEFVEEIARSHLKELVDLGHRVAGSTSNEVDAVNYILRSVKDIDALPHPSLKLEVDIHNPTGSFTIDFLGGFASYYSNITNTIVKLSPIKSSSKQALLLNCHTDSVSGSPGASDDGVACAVLLEVMRALVADKNNPLLHPIIFLFNGAEENILQASHGFITKHQWARDVVAFVNLEAAGAGGKEMVFQTGPDNPWLAMTWAAHAPHPFGSVVGQELFQSGIIPSDTDFRIFRDYGNIPGIDLAYTKNGYVYHTPYDNMDMIQPGCIQRAGDNILAVVRNLVTSKTSLLPNPATYRHGSTVFVDLLGIYMLIVPFRLVAVLNFLCSVGGLLFIVRRIIFANGTPAILYGKQLMQATATIILSWLACMSVVVVIAGFVTKFGNPMSFYSMPNLVVFLYALPGLGAMLAVHACARRWIFKVESSWALETIFFDAFLVIWSAILFQLNYLQLRSSFLFLLSLAPVFLLRCIFLRSFFDYKNGANPVKRIVLYLLALVPHTIFVLSHSIMIMHLFVPLCGRIGSEIPPDLVISLLSAFLVCLACHFFLSLVHVTNSLRWVGLGIGVASVCAVSIATSSHGFPYAMSASNPTAKRLFLQHTSREFYDVDKNLAKKDSGLWVNTMDYPGFSVDMGDGVLEHLPTVPCAGLFCHFPYSIPIQMLVKNPKYVPVAEPRVRAMKENPFSLKIVDERIETLKENSTTRIYKKYLRYRISGPNHMSVQIGPLSTDESTSALTGWSLDGDIKVTRLEPTAHPTVENYSYSDWRFLYYGSGLNPEPWEPWFEFTVTQRRGLPSPGSPGSPLLAEISFSAQYYSENPTIPIAGDTDELESFVRTIHDWVMPISWVSLYRNYLF